LKKVIKTQYFWYAAVSAIMAGLFAYAPQITAGLPAPFHTEPLTPYYLSGYRLLLPLAVLFAAWKFGIKGGLIVCFLVGPAILISVFINSKFPNILIDILDIALGLVLSWMVGTQSNTKRRLEETAGELEKNTQKLKSEVGERKRAEEQYKLIADHTADIIYKLSLKEQRFNYVSPSAERTLGYTTAEALAIKLTDLLTADSLIKQNTELVSAIHKGYSSATLQLDLKHKDGHIIPFEVHSELIFDENNQPAEIVGVARDITKRKKMEEQLMMQDRLASLGQLTSGMAHELNNPLTSIINFSTLLLKKDLDEDTRQDIETINEEAQRIAGSVKNLVTFSRKQPLQKQLTNINDTIRKVLDMRKYEQQVNNIKVITNYDPNLPLVLANAPQLEQVFFNITINAEYFMVEANKQGVLEITTKKDGNNVCAVFTDNGPGISPENQKRLFSPLFSTKEAGKGTGLSMSISRGIVLEHNGRLYIDDKTGKGATFVIELPASE
jgi:PAS domain S-box-containing protein